MDIVGPLPKSQSGKRFILVICDYATRLPEAIPMKAVHVAEELLVYCSRFGVPQEILTDQGANLRLSCSQSCTECCTSILSERHRITHKRTGLWSDLI